MNTTTTPDRPVRAPAAAIAALGTRARSTLPHQREATAAAERFLFAEARLLDGRRYEEWLDLWEPAGLLWVPLDPDRAEDPTEHQSLLLDDRARLGERIERLRSRSGWSQIPPTRTVRHLGNVEAWSDGDALEVRSVLTLHTWRAGRPGLLAGRQEHRLVRADGTFRIALKVLDLLGADGPQPNISHLL